MPQKSRHILLVEDDHILQQITTRLLDIAGCSFRVSSNGQEGYDAVQEEKFDLILMDIMMPIMDGIQASELIMDQLGDQAPPIVMVTAYDTPDVRRQCSHLGIFDFITKPLTLEKLKQILTQI